MKHIITLILLAGLWMPLAAQKVVPLLPTDVIARVGGSVITAKDLMERIELMPWPEKENPKRHDSSKVKALNSLVAERLLSIEGRMRNVGGDELARGKLKTLEKLFVRDELYKREVTRKISVSEKELWTGLAKFQWQLHLAAVALKDERAADSLYRTLRRMPSLGAALNGFPSAYVVSVETVQVNFGGLDTVFENAVYAIGTKKFTKPFDCPTYGWTVAVLIDRGANPVAEKMSPGDRRHRVEETIRNMKEGPVARRFIASVLVSRKATVDSVVFETLAGALHAIIARDSVQHFKNGMFSLTSEDVDELETVLHSERNKSFVQMTDEPLTLVEAIEGFRHLRLGFVSLDMRKFKSTLNNHLRYVVETELLAREGYRRNLQHSESVKRDVEVWGKYWASRHLMWNVDDTVRASDDEVLAALSAASAEMGRWYEVNIREVFCRDLAVAERVMNEAALGTPLAELARKYSDRTEWKARDGVSGFMPLTAHPELTRRAFLADTGALIGPVKLDDGYSIFTVIAKRKTGGEDLPDADSVGIFLANNLTTVKRQRTMNTFIAGLARQYAVDIKYEKLPGITIQPANMFTRRNIGFGGVVTAVPVLYPNWEWMKEYRDGGNINP